MKATFTWVAGGAFLALTAVSAQADCAAELARLTEGGAAAEGISKDGSLAPLEGAPDAAAGSDAAATEAADTAEAAGMNSAAPTPEGAADGAASTDTAGADGGEGIAKDGTHVPLEDASGQQAGVAMSGADAQAQQEGQPTAAEQASGGAMDHSGREAHIQAARDALAAGNEDACMEAVKAAQSS
ncbi:hypothetical protein PARHAE_01268 [Paracoccus haematequi]|uniref:Uncharacterized protein n=1 Tax=Paracoccus haematequi TaxID=2491866 RepID=A0A3S4ER33_9RHOB|nr:hypothetical protein [Paracoccus haematequi]VDS08087.1 hypothetical protein PARHAE_01268 [Paracoccus haematequi]